MNILILGLGYLGKPVYEEIKKKYPKDNVIGIDSRVKQNWCRDVHEQPINNIVYPKDHINIDLTKYNLVKDMLRMTKPEVIINTAAQPSLPFSMRDRNLANYTQFNNMTILMNLIWAIKELELSNKTHLIHCTTTGVYGAPTEKVKEDNSFVSDGGSFYHMAKCFDTSNLRVAQKWGWVNKVTDVRVGILYGHKDNSIFVDKNFGVVVHKFVHEALQGQTMKIYGKGLQKKPFCYIDDAVDSIVNLIDKPMITPPYFFVMNQCAETESILELAKTISKETGAKYEHIENPRAENEEHQLELENYNFKLTLCREPTKLKEGIPKLIKSLKEMKLYE